MAADDAAAKQQLMQVGLQPVPTLAARHAHASYSATAFQTLAGALLDDLVPLLQAGAHAHGSEQQAGDGQHKSSRTWSLGAGMVAVHIDA